MGVGRRQVSYYNSGRQWLWNYLPLAMWMALIYWLSSQPRLVEIEDVAGEVVFFKSAHLVAYAVLMWLSWRVLSPQRRITRLSMSLAFLITVLYGLSDEFHQLYVPGRHGRLSDVLVDSLGALIMVALLPKWSFLRLFPENMGRMWTPSSIQVSKSE